jgi:hypothetical protein
LDGSLQRWTSAVPPGAVELRLRSAAPVDAHPGPLFKLCWDAVAAGVSRLTCQVHRREDGQVVGLEVVDTDAASGTRTWIGWR